MALTFDLCVGEALRDNKGSEEASAERPRLRVAAHLERIGKGRRSSRRERKDENRQTEEHKGERVKGRRGRVRGCERGVLIGVVVNG